MSSKKVDSVKKLTVLSLLGFLCAQFLCLQIWLLERRPITVEINKLMFLDLYNLIKL